MCGTIVLFGREIFIPCLVQKPEFHWRPDPDPLIDFTRMRFRRDELQGPLPDPWKIELTAVAQMLELAGRFENLDMAEKLGSVIAEVGTEIAARAEVDVQFGWERPRSVEGEH